MKATRVFAYAGVFAAGALAVVGYLWLGGPSLAGQTATQGASESTQPNASEPLADGQAAEAPAAEAPEAGTPAADTTAIADVVRNTMVTLSGTVQRISDEDEFVLEDATGSITVWTGTQLFTVDQGENVTVTGFVDDGLLIEIYAQEILKADGSVVTIGGSSER